MTMSLLISLRSGFLEQHESDMHILLKRKLGYITRTTRYVSILRSRLSEAEAGLRAAEKIRGTL